MATRAARALGEQSCQPARHRRGHDRRGPARPRSGEGAGDGAGGRPALGRPGAAVRRARRRRGAPHPAIAGRCATTVARSASLVAGWIPVRRRCRPRCGRPTRRWRSTPSLPHVARRARPPEHGGQPEPDRADRGLAARPARGAPVEQRGGAGPVRPPRRSPHARAPTGRSCGDRRRSTGRSRSSSSTTRPSGARRRACWPQLLGVGPRDRGVRPIGDASIAAGGLTLRPWQPRRRGLRLPRVPGRRGPAVDTVAPALHRPVTPSGCSSCRTRAEPRTSRRTSPSPPPRPASCSARSASRPSTGTAAGPRPGYWVAPEARGRGVATLALRALVSWAGSTSGSGR